MKALVVFLLLLIVIGGAVFLFGDELGLTQQCATPLCRNNAQFMRDFCSSCRQAIDDANAFLDGIQRFFR